MCTETQSKIGISKIGVFNSYFHFHDKSQREPKFHLNSFQITTNPLVLHL